MLWKLRILVIFHVFVVAGNAIAFLTLPFYEPPHISLPLCSFILWVTFTRDQCPLTRMENKMREKLGMPTINGFVKHYILEPLREENAKGLNQFGKNAINVECIKNNNIFSGQLISPMNTTQAFSEKV